MDREKLLTVSLILFLIVLTIQSVQLNSLNYKLKTGSFNINSGNKLAGSNPSESDGGTQLPSNLQDLPSMVGGC